MQLSKSVLIFCGRKSATKKLECTNEQLGVFKQIFSVDKK